MRFHVLLTVRGVIICKDNYLPERELVAPDDGCHARIGPFPPSRMADYLTENFPDLWPIAEVQLAQLQASLEPYCLLTFQSPRPRPQSS